MTDYGIPEFGLFNDDFNWVLLKYLSPAYLSKVPLLDFQIDYLANKLDWVYMSKKNLSKYIIIKHHNKINWPLFLTNGFKKDMSTLDQVRDTFFKYIYVINDNKDTYFKNIEFIQAFPEIVDWKYVAKNIQIPDNLLLRHWSKMSINSISIHQKLSSKVMSIKRSNINWRYACRKPISEFMLSELSDSLDWNMVCKYQILSESFIIKHKSKCNAYHISRYQKLSDSFILQYRNWLNMEIISQYQNMSSSTLRKLLASLSIPKLLKNKNYNHPDTVQIIQSTDKKRWYIIDEPMISDDTAVHFCNIETYVEEDLPLPNHIVNVYEQPIIVDVSVYE